MTIGTQTTLRMNHWEGDPPVEGDFLRTRAGTCYQINEIHPSRSPRIIYRLRVTRLGKDAVQFGDPGVTMLVWGPRR